jgi:ACS family glucarate transporter-like MFS transporter
VQTTFPIRWALVAWIFVISAIGYLDRVNISIAGQSIQKEFHFNNVQLGWIFSAFVLGYALFQAPAGRLADRFGPRLILTLGVLWWGIFTSLITVFAPGPSSLILSLIATRFLLGMGEAVIYPASNCIVASWIPSPERGIANGVIFSGVGFGAALTPPLITWLLSHYGWRSSFWASACLGLAAGGVWFIIARNRPVAHPWVSPQELAHIQTGLPHPPKSDPPHLPTQTLAWRSILTNSNIWFVTASYFCYGYAAYIFFSWFFIYLSSVRGLNLRESSYYAMLPFAAMAIGSPVGGWISDRLTKRVGKRAGRCGVAAFGIALSAIFIALGTQVDSARLATVVLAAGAGALYLSQSSFWSVSADIGGPSAGSVSGFMNMGGQIGGALTASLTPAIASHWGWTASFLVAAALCVLGALLWTLVIL